MLLASFLGVGFTIEDEDFDPAMDPDTMAFFEQLQGNRAQREKVRVTCGILGIMLIANFQIN